MREENNSSPTPRNFTPSRIESSRCPFRDSQPRSPDKAPDAALQVAEPPIFSSRFEGGVPLTQRVEQEHPKRPHRVNGHQPEAGAGLRRRIKHKVSKEVVGRLSRE